MKKLFMVVGLWVSLMTGQGLAQGLNPNAQLEKHVLGTYAKLVYTNYVDCYNKALDLWKRF